MKSYKGNFASLKYFKISKAEFSYCSGKATPKGTKSFILDSRISLYHKFHKSQLFINPIAISHPTSLCGASTDLTYQQYEHCVKKNRSNCLSVYYHNGVDQEWYFKDLNKLLARTQIPREQVVLTATLAVSVFPQQDIKKQIERIKTACLVTNVDIIIIECDALTYQNDSINMNRCITALEETDLCGNANSTVQFYGININLAPYTLHKPQKSTHNTYMSVPSILEEFVFNGKFCNLDLFVYPLSLTSSTIATYPMLDPDVEKYPDINPDDLIGNEKSRTFSRIAKNPFSCYFGTVKGHNTKMLNSRGITVSIPPPPDDKRINKKLLQQIIEKYKKQHPSDYRKCEEEKEKFNTYVQELKEQCKNDENDDSDSTINVNRNIASSSCSTSSMSVEDIQIQLQTLFIELNTAIANSSKDVNTDVGSPQHSSSSESNSNSDDDRLHHSMLKTEALAFAKNVHKMKKKLIKLEAAMMKLNSSEIESEKTADINDITETQELIDGLYDIISDLQQQFSGSGLTPDELLIDDEDEDDDDRVNDNITEMNAAVKDDLDDDDYEVTSHNNSSTTATANLTFQNPFVLVAGVNALTQERNLAAKIDEYCPELETTPALHDKTIRAIFSVGIDAVLVDPSIAVQIPKLSLTPEDMIIVHDTEELFGEFTLPSSYVK